MRRTIQSGTEWEAAVGYARAVRVDRQVFVSGTTAVNADGALVGEGDARAQTVFVLQKIAAALEEAGASMADVVRTRIFVTDIDTWETIGRAHGEVFAAVRPACTMVEVSRLVAPGMLVEIEADAVCDA